ncbi:hypothetical protein [Streptomyces sp. YIM S03343]
MLLGAFAAGTLLALLTYSAVAHGWETLDLPGPFGRYRTLWAGLAIAVVMSAVSYALALDPGHVYGLIGFFVVAPARGEPRPERRLQAVVLAAWVTFAAALACWFLWRRAASTPSYDLFLQTLTVVALETAFFALLPVPGLDGGELLQNRPYSWLVTFTPMPAAWFYLTWITATSTPWAQLAKATVVLLVAAVLSGLLWSYARRRAERLAAITDDEEENTTSAAP